MLGKCKNLSSNPQNPCKIWIWYCVYNPRVPRESKKHRKENPWKYVHQIAWCIAVPHSRGAAPSKVEGEVLHLKMLSDLHMPRVHTPTQERERKTEREIL